jgi:hypothetical protein
MISNRIMEGYVYATRYNPANNVMEKEEEEYGN